MLSYSFNYKSFLGRFYAHAKFFLFGILIAFWAGVSFTGNVLLSAIIAAVFLIVIILSLFKWNIYFIEELKISENVIYLKVYRYNKIYIDETLKLTDIVLKVGSASSSKRGLSYNLSGKLDVKNFTQYEVMGWKKEYFDNIIRSCTNGKE